MKNVYRYAQIKLKNYPDQLNHKALITLLCLAMPFGVSADNEQADKPSSEKDEQYIEDGVTETRTKTDQEKSFQLMLGGGVFYGPKYEGHDEKDTKFFPMLSLSYGDFSLGMKGLRYKFYQADKTRFSLGLTYDDGRDSSDLPRDKRDLGEIDGGINLSVSGEISLLDRLSLEMSASKSLEHHRRFQASVKLGSLFPIYQKRIMGKLSAATTWQDSELSTLYYGVSNEQAVKTGLPEFKVDAGFKALSYSATSIFNINQHLNLSFSIVYQQLQGDAAETPVTDKVDDFSVIQTLLYRF